MYEFAVICAMTMIARQVKSAQTIYDVLAVACWWVHSVSAAIRPRGRIMKEEEKLSEKEENQLREAPPPTLGQ